MKKTLLSALFVAISLIAFSQYNSGSITILHTNDMHSKLIGFSPELEYTPLSIKDDNTKGGFARLATIIKQVQEEKAGQALVLDAGDFLMGSFFHLLEEETG
ncbi:MAG: bifunctional metallophosphatase/5'-nucleotidase, partial [Bacteroidales bacterium]|nr:bifunctional metallophosphatase/5'-nucleotidase [Bacteroidales bacterium]